MPMDNGRTYIAILIDSLNKKIEVLNRIKDINASQRDVASNGEFDDEQWEKTLDEKAILIDKLQELNNGFESVYERVRSELNEKSSEYKEEITQLKSLISKITDLSMDIQAEEKRNSELVTKCFTKMRTRLKATKDTNKVANSYMQTMAKMNYVEPQFMDKKK